MINKLFFNSQLRFILIADESQRGRYIMISIKPTGNYYLPTIYIYLTSSSAYAFVFGFKLNFVLYFMTNYVALKNLH